MAFTIDKIYLKNSQFDLQNSNIEKIVDNDMKVQIKIDIKKDLLIISLNLKSLVGNKNNQIFSVSVEMIGEFRMVSEMKKKQIEDFANIHGPAIIFPYIREHISNLTTKALIPPFILDPVNFVQMYKERIKE